VAFLSSDDKKAIATKLKCTYSMVSVVLKAPEKPKSLLALNIMECAIELAKLNHKKAKQFAASSIKFTEPTVTSNVLQYEGVAGQ